MSVEAPLQVEYRKLQVEIEKKINRLQKKLDDHAKLTQSKINYGHVGDLQHINEKLNDLLMFG